MSTSHNITGGRVALAFVALMLVPMAVGIVSGIVVAKYSNSQRSSVESARQLRNTVTSLQRAVDRLQSKLADMENLPTRGDQNIVLYRVKQLESHIHTNDGRIENLNNTQIRICQKIDIVCAGKNAVWLMPRSIRPFQTPLIRVTETPWPPIPRRPPRFRVALHDTLKTHRQFIEPITID